MTHLLLTVRFLDDRYHGLLDRGGPVEWPPSPFRLFQAMIAGVARRGELVIGEDVPSNTNFTPVGHALGWLQRHTREHPPIIIAPKAKPGQAITRFVPNNDGDKKFDRQKRLTAKSTIPTLFLLEPDQKPEVHYAWPLDSVKGCPVADLERAARSLTTLGWGIDMAFANARLAPQAELEALKGIRWCPKNRDYPFDETLRTPTYDDEFGECTLCDLRHCHSTFINRIEHGKPLKTVDKPKVFDRVLYTSVERQERRHYAVFRLLDDSGSPVRYPHARLIHIAGMVRHVAIERMKVDAPAWKRDDPAWVETFVCGHRRESERHEQISYVPLPSIGHEHADALVRNVLLVAPLGCERELEHVAARVNGLALEPESDSACAWESDCRPSPLGDVRLERFKPPEGRFIQMRYLCRSNEWHSVTPVILDGHARRSRSDKPKEVGERTASLIQTALSRAGIETPCKFTWQSIPFLKNCLSAHKYDRDRRATGYHRPKHLRTQTAVHLRLSFEHPVPGPLTIGAGRHCGFGLMAAVGD